MRPSGAIRKVVGNARTSQRRPAIESRSSTHSSGSPLAANGSSSSLIRFSRSSRLPCSAELTSITTARPANSFCSRASSGIAARQGPHQVAKKSTTTGFGRAAVRFQSPPPSFGSASSGAGSPALSASTSLSSSASLRASTSAASPSTFCRDAVSSAKVASVGASLGRFDFEVTTQSSFAPSSTRSPLWSTPVARSTRCVSGS